MHNVSIEFNPNFEVSRKNIAIALDFSNADELALNHALELGGKEAKYTLIHVVESVGAIMYGKNIKDQETKIDEKLLNMYKENLVHLGYKIDIKLGFGKPTNAIAKIVNAHQFDILVMGTHGHTGFKDVLFGTTVDKLRHSISIPLYIVKKD